MCQQMLKLNTRRLKTISMFHIQAGVASMYPLQGAPLSQTSRQSGHLTTHTSSMHTCKISSVVSVSVALAEPSARSGSRPRVMRVCLAGASPEQVHVRLSVVSTGTATVSTGMLGLYLATRRAVEPPLVKTTMSEACTCIHNKQPFIS